MHVQKQQLEADMEQWTGSKLEKEYIKAVYCLCLFKLYSECIIRNARLHEAQAEIKIARREKKKKIARRNISNLRYADDTTLMAESEDGLKSL